MKGKFLTVILSTALLAAQSADASTQQGLQALRAGDFQGAYGYLRLEALNGDPNAQFAMCGMYFQGQGVPKNEYEAFKWCQLAAEQGNTEAAYNLALFYQKGTGVGQNINQAMQWYQVAAERGHKDAQFNLLQLYNANLADNNRPNVGSSAKLAAVVPPVGVTLDKNGNPVNMNPFKIAGAQQDAPMQQNAPQQQAAPQQQQQQTQVPAVAAIPPQAPTQVASVPAEIPHTQYMSVAAPEQQAVAASAAPAQVVSSVAAAPVQAAAAVPQAAPAIAAQVAAPVAAVTAQAISAPAISPAPTPAPIQMAPVQEFQQAQLPEPARPSMTLEEQKEYNLQQGCLLAAQQGIAADNCEDDKPVIKKVEIAKVQPEQTKADVQNSIGWFEKQAELGDLAAQNNLGVMYRRGMGVAKNPTKAFDLFQKSAARGSPNGMLNLANMYKLGEGTEQNLELSYAWYNLAADRIPTGEMKKSALNNIKEISGYMDNQQIGDALAYVTKLDETIPLAE